MATNALSDYLENKLLDHVLGGSTFTQPSNKYLALFTSATSDSAIGTEVTGGSYARQSLTFGTAASGGSKANTVAVTFTNMPACTVTHAAIMDASTGGTNILFHGALATGLVIAAADNLVFAIGDIICTLD